MAVAAAPYRGSRLMCSRRFLRKVRSKLRAPGFDGLLGSPCDTLLPYVLGFLIHGTKHGERCNIHYVAFY